MRSEVQILPGPPSRAIGRPVWVSRFAPAEEDTAPTASSNGGIAQLGERLLCKQEVVGSIPSASTIIYRASPRGIEREYAGHGVEFVL